MKKTSNSRLCFSFNRESKRVTTASCKLLSHDMNNIISSNISDGNAFGLQKYTVFINLNYVIAVFAILENLFIVLLFVQQRKTLDISHKFVISMVCADLLEGLIGAPLTAVMASGLRAGSPLCLGTLSTKITIHMILVSCVVMTTFDRFWAVIAPFNHRYYRTPKFAKSKKLRTLWGT